MKPQLRKEKQNKITVIASATAETNLLQLIEKKEFEKIKEQAVNGAKRVR